MEDLFETLAQATKPQVLKRVVYRESKDNLISIVMPKDIAMEIWNNGFTIFNGVTYLKEDTISIGAVNTSQEGLTLTVNINNLGSITNALDNKGTRHQPQYLDYGKGLLTDSEHLQMFKLRFGYKEIILK